MTQHGVTGGEAGHQRARRSADPARGTGSAPVPAGGSWRALVELVAAAMTSAVGSALDTALQPALRPALAGVPAQRRSAFGLGMAAADTPGQPMQAVDSTIRVPLTSRRPSPFPQSNDVAGGRSPADAHEPIEADHAETWALVTAAQCGDGEAFGKLYDRYVDSVFRFIYYRVNDRALAEDFTSETFLRALRRISAINYQGRDIGAWFMTIARNIVFDHSKSARFRLELTTGDIIEGDEREASTESAVLAHLTNQRLMQAVNSLNEEQKECIVLRFLNGLSVAETAEVMGKNDGAIKALQHRAVKRLAALVADELR